VAHRGRGTIRGVAIKLALFDFDGTLADSFPWFLEAFDQVADRYGFRQLDRGEINELRQLNARQLLAHYGIPTWKVPLIARHFRMLMRRDIAAIKPVPGIEAALRGLAEKGLELGILTSNTRENVTQVLSTSTSELFRYWECGSGIFGKTSKLRKLLRTTGYASDEVIFVGDEIRDADAARGAGVAFGAVSWGFTHLNALIAGRTAETFFDASELLSKIIV
jgi:phosphoglycolate phosphatase